MSFLDLNYNINNYTTSKSSAMTSLISSGGGGLRLVSGAPTRLTLDETKGSKTKAHIGYSNFWDDAYTNGQINGIEGFAPQNLTSVSYKLHLAAGDQIRLNYDFIPGDNKHNDFAFALLANSAGIITPLRLADVNAWITSGHNTHYTAVLPIGASGDYTLLLGVSDAGDKVAPSALVLRTLTIELPVATNAFALKPNGFLLADGSLLSKSSLAANSQSALVSLNAALGAGLISQDGAGLIAQDGGGFKLPNNVSLIAQDGGGLISQDGAGLIAAGAGNFGVAGATTLVFSTGDTASLARQAADFNAGQAAAALAKSASVVSNDGGSFISHNGSALIATGGGNFHVLGFSSVAPPPPVLADAPDVGTDFTLGNAATAVNAQYSPAIAALANGRFATAYVSESKTGKTSIQVQLTAANGTKVGSILTLSGFSNELGVYDPSIVALLDGGFAVGWTTVGLGTQADGTGGLDSDIRLNLFDGNGTQGASYAGSANGNQGQTSLAVLANGNILMTFRDDNQTDGTNTLRYQTFKPRSLGAGIAATALTNPAGTSYALNPAAAALPDGRFAIAYSDSNGFPSGDQTGIYVHVVNPGVSDTVYQVNTTATGTQDYPAVATLANGNLVVAWLDENAPSGSPVGYVRAQIITPAGAKVGGEILVSDNIKLGSVAPSVLGLPDGRFIVSWSPTTTSGTTITSTFVRATIYNADGTASTDPFNVESGSNTSQPDLAQAPDGTIYVASNHAVGTSSDIRVAPLTLPGTLTLPTLAADIRVGDAANGGQDSRTSAIAGLPGGKSVVVWQSNPTTNGGGAFAIYGQLLNADGTAAGSVFTISASTGFDQVAPSVTGLPGGGFVVAWANRHLTDTGRSYDISARIFDVAAAPVASQFYVNTTLTYDQVAPNVASLATGGFVVTWTNGFQYSNGAAASVGYGARGQRYDAAGTAQGAEFRVGAAPVSGQEPTQGQNTVSTGTPDGGFVSVYYGVKIGTTGVSGLYGQVFNAAGTGATPFAITTTGFYQYASVAALPGGGFVVAWSEIDNSVPGALAEGYLGAIRAQAFTAAGVATSAVVTVTTNADVATDRPAITTLYDGRVMIAWDSYVRSFVTASGYQEDVKARLFNADLTPSGPIIDVDTPNRLYRTSAPAITQTEQGGIIITTTRGNGDTAESGAQATNSDSITEEVHVTTFDPPSAARPVSLVRGTLVDGYIFGATVFADTNGNGVLDAGEQSAITGENGEFYLTSTAKGPLLSIGGRDAATNVLFTGKLTAPEGSASITALSTLVQRIAATNGGDVGAAIARVNTALGLPADAAITAIDPIQATLGYSSTAADAFLANANLFGSVALASAAGATGDLFAKLANAIGSGTGTFDPTSVATMTTLGLTGQVATDTAAIATSQKLLLATKLAAHPNDPTGLVSDIYAVETAVQAQAAPALQTAAANGTTASVAGTYTGNNLTAIAGAAADTAAGNAPTISYTDTVTNTVGYARADTYAGPVDYLQKQYIWGSNNAVALRAAAPNAFIKGGSSGDALVATGGKNVLDGAGGSNYLIGADGSDGGFDTFFVDGRGSVETWSTIINFHFGDQATIFGFHPGLSTMPFTENEGAAGATGLTIHSELNGPGTGILASMTFTGLTKADADAHFSITTGTLLPGTAGAIDYMLIQYNR